MKQSVMAVCMAAVACSMISATALADSVKGSLIVKEKLTLVQEWDKVFPQSDKVTHSKVTFTNRFGVTLAADMYVPKNAKGKLAAIAVSGPFGAVKEQASGLYAHHAREQRREARPYPKD